jgi:sulfonate transport system permease protein
MTDNALTQSMERLAVISVAPTRKKNDLRKQGEKLVRHGGRIIEMLIIPALALTLWTMATHFAWLPSQILPSPKLVVATFHELLVEGDIAANLGISLTRVVEGFSIGAVIGIPLGIAMGIFPLVDDCVCPLFKAFAQVPSLAWIPLLMLVFGIEEALKLVVITRACMVPMTLTARDGIRNIPVSYLEVAKALNLRPMTRLTRIVLPAVVPSAFSGIRQGLGHAWVSLVVVEMLASAEGIGYLMAWGRLLFQLDIVMVCMAIVGTIGFAMDCGLKSIESRLLRWRTPAL